MSAPSRTQRLALAVGVGVVGLVADLWSKAWAWNTMRGVREPMDVLGTTLQFDFSFNTGSAFGMLADVGWARGFFIAMTVLAIGYVVWVAATMDTARRRGFVALGLVGAGALGNLHDRFVRADELGRYGVVDFIRINYPWSGGGSWPTFNVADVLLLVGVGLLLWEARTAERGRRAAVAPAASTADLPSAP